LLVSVPAAAVSVQQMKIDVQTLSSDAFEGRAPGTPGGDKAVAYIVERMKAAGLKPGNNGSWTQDVPLASITVDPAVTLDIGGGVAPIKLDFVKDMVVWTKRQVAQQVLDKAPVVFVGYGINAPEKGWNDYAGVDVRGKTVIILINDPDWQTKASGKAAGPFEGRAMTYYGRWTYKYEEAMRQGAAAALIIHDDEPAAYPFTVISSTAKAPRIDIDLPDKGMGRVGVEGWLTKPAATRVLAAAGLDLATLEAAAKVKGFKAVETKLVASAVLNNKITHALSKNVVGVLSGVERPGEVVLYSAHWDHLGRCAPDATGDDICNGALDNASGVSGLLAIAADFAKAKRMARSVVFLAVTGEESGLLGSGWYAQNPVYPLAKTVGGVNMDVLNLIGRRDGLTITGGGKSELEAMATRLAAAQGRKIVPEATPEKGYYFRSDHFSFAKLGVPMLDAGSGGELNGKPAGTAEALEKEYTEKHYHQPSDEYDANWDWAGAVQDLTLYEQLGRELANGATWPNWLPDSEFRAIRDASQAVAK
jgi:Zn-dependent M28 family amino/carboxypeptidase